MFKTLQQKVSIPSSEWYSIGKGALIAFAASLVTYVIQTFINEKYGYWSLFIMAVISVIINWIRKIVTNTVGGKELPYTTPQTDTSKQLDK